MHHDTSILVTGGAGFVGSNLVRLIRHTHPDWRVVNFDALTYAGNLASLDDLRDDPCHDFVHGDLLDRAALDRALDGCRFVIHCAAESHVDRSISNSAPFLSTNVLGTQNLLDACLATSSIERIVHVSTDEVYGALPLDRPDLAFTESDPIAPNSPYAASKAASDLLALASHHTYGLPVIVSRCSNNLGPYQFPEKLIPRFISNLVDGRTVPLYGDGLHVRDWIHVQDHAEALLRILDGGRVGDVYNIGANNERSNLELTHMILETMGLDDAMIERVDDRLGHDRRYAVDASKLMTELDWKPRHSDWPDALHGTIDWYLQNEPWWRPLTGDIPPAPTRAA